MHAGPAPSVRALWARSIPCRGDFLYALAAQVADVPIVMKRLAMLHSCIV